MLPFILPFPLHPLCPLAPLPVFFLASRSRDVCFFGGGSLCSSSSSSKSSSAYLFCQSSRSFMALFSASLLLSMPMSGLMFRLGHIGTPSGENLVSFFATDGASLSRDFPDPKPDLGAGFCLSLSFISSSSIPLLFSFSCFLSSSCCHFFSTLEAGEGWGCSFPFFSLPML